MGSNTTVVVFDHHDYFFGSASVLFRRNDQVNTTLNFIDYFVKFLYLHYVLHLFRNEYDGKYAASAFWTKEFGLRIEFFGQNNDPLKVKKGVARAYYRPDLSKNG